MKDHKSIGSTLKALLINLISKINKIQFNLKISLDFITIFPWLSLFAYPIFGVLFYNTQPIYINFIGFFLSAIVLCTYYIPHIPIKYLYISWFLYIIYCMVFDLGYGLLLNPQDSAYQLAFMLMLIATTVIVNNIFALCIILLIGVSAAISLSDTNISQIYQLLDLSNIGSVYILGILFGLAFMHKKNKLEKNRLHDAMAMLHRINHEVNTPLATINISSSTLSAKLPKLLKDYITIKSQTSTISITERQMIHSLNTIPQVIQHESKNIHDLVNILLMNLRSPEQFKQQYTSVSMYECIEEAITRYQYTNDFPKEKIHWEKSIDFNFYGVKMLMVHVLLNLMKNAHHAIDKKNTGDIKIHNENKKNFSYLYFQDSATGIRKEKLDKLFQYYYTTKESGTGLGLQFCKKIIDQSNGKIWCESVYGKYTKFIIRLPII